jgi:hypothetical protein
MSSPLPWTTAKQRWSELDSLRQSFITNCEKYAAFTVPKICLPNGYDRNNDELRHDYQSLGAQGVNHLTNKLMLALFAPSRPFFRLDPGDKMLAEIAEAGVNEEELQSQLAAAEKKAVRVLDQLSIRPKLFEAIKHLIITGNVLLVLDKKPRVLGLKNYVVKRSPDGTVLEIVVREKVAFLALTPDIQALLAKTQTCDHNTVVEQFKWVRRAPDGRYRMSAWINDQPLPQQYNAVWTEEKLPYRALTWDLASGDDYGTGHVEDYCGDFASLSMMSESTVHAAILASEYRWLVNPAGQTKPEDFEKSRNGAALPGVEGDIHLVQSGNGSNLQTNLAIAEMYINRIGRGFLLGSAVTRDAERVTAEEIRMTADELETGLGGAYSRIAVDFQGPLAFWLMDQSGQKIAGFDLKPTIVTGLDALSRVGDRDNLVLFLGDLVSLGNIPPDIRIELKLNSIIASFAAARGLAKTQYTKTAEQVQADMQKQQQEAIAMQAASAEAQAQAKA